MQVVCSNCQLSFQAPEGAAGLVCPICRSPLSAPEGGGEAAAPPTKQVLDWSGGTLDDLVALLSAPAWSARIEVLGAGNGTVAGEVHVIAGGVSDALFEGKSTYDALDKLRAVKGARFRVEPRLPNPANGDLSVPGPDQGKLEERPLATLMRYCEEFVLTASIEVWRGSENAKVDYRRGEIVGVTVGGIDAPERLAEVMKWASGSYRLMAPKLTLPETAPKAAAPAAVVAPRSTGAPSKTIFGMPALDPAAIAAAAEKARQAKTGNSGPVASPGLPPPAAQPPQAVKPTPGKPTPAPAATAQPANVAARATTTTAVVPPAGPAAATPAAARANASATNKTIFGVAPPAAAASPPAGATAPAARTSSPGTPAVSSSTPAPAAAAPAQAARSATPAEKVPEKAAEKAPEKVVEKALEKATDKAAEKKSEKAAEKAAEKANKQPRTPAAAAGEDATLPTKAPKGSKGTPVWTYVGVGFLFGLALLGVYRLVMVLAH